MGQIVGTKAKPKRANLNALSQVGTPALGEYVLVSSDDSMNAAGQGNFDCYIVGDGTTVATELEVQKINGDFYNKVTPTFTVESGFYKEDKKKYSGNDYTCAFVDVSNLVGYRLKISSFVLSVDATAKTFFVDSSGTIISTWISSQGNTMVVPSGAISLYISNKTTDSSWSVTLVDVVFINKMDAFSGSLSSINNRLDGVDEELYYSPTVPQFTINTGSYYKENLSKASHGSFSCAKVNVENLNGCTLKISPFSLASDAAAKTSFVNSNGGVLATWHSGEGNTHIVPNGAVLLYVSNRTTNTWTVTLADDVKLSKIEEIDDRVAEIESAIDSGQIGGGGGGGAVTEYTTLESTSYLPSTAEANEGYIIDGNLWLYTTTGWQNIGAFRGPKGDQGDQGPQGLQGNSGVSDASTAELINNLDDGGQTKFLSAEMGKSLGTYSRYNNKNYKLCCFGDSITSNQVVNVGGSVRSILNMSTLTEDTADGNASYVNAVGNVTTDFGNLACGNATLTDYWSNGVNATTIRLLKSDNVFGHSGSGYNVLSNQIRRLLWHTTASDSTIQWTDYNNTTHYIYELDNTLYEGTSIPTGATGVTGKGYTSDIPNLIYIAIGTNDRNSSTFENDDIDATFSETYANLTRRTFSSALRWAIETLQIVYPSATIAVATPLHRTTSAGVSLANQNLKAQLIKDVCKRLGVAVIDEFSSSGIGQNSLSWLTQDGTHPNSDGKRVVSRFVAGQLLSIFGVLK